MKECIVYGETLTSAYHKSLIELENIGDITDCSDWNTTQKELSMTMVIEHPLDEPMISKCFYGGPEELEQYVQEMVDGILDFEVDRGKLKYTYHDRMVHFPTWKGAVNQINFVLDELKRNPNSRRAVLDIRDNSRDIYSDEPACLQHIQYFIRDGKLHCKVLFRSNDACKATFMNAFALIMLQKKFADELGIDVGSYTHRANSFHCYARDFELLKSYTDRIKSDKDITYEYIGCWDELMEECKQKIKDKIHTLKFDI